jgi:tryptophan synthase alpha chain
MNYLDAVFQSKIEHVLALYAVVHFPTPHDFHDIIDALIESTVDIIELGIPFSDPIADGPIIQNAHQQALRTYSGIKDILDIARVIRSRSSKAIVVMGYLNSMLAFGMDNFLISAHAAGIDGVIVPDLSPEEFVLHYQDSFKRASISPIFLVSPQTSDERVQYIDSLSKGFLYAVSGLSTTGNLQRSALQTQQRAAYLERLSRLKLRNPIMVGFGICSKSDRDAIASCCAGTIIGSAFLSHIQNYSNMTHAVHSFLETL